jgi:hypothetical protein
VSDWQMRRIESPTEDPCCALVKEAGECKATVYFVPETQTWAADVMQGERLILRWDDMTLSAAVACVERSLDYLR